MRSNFVKWVIKRVIVPTLTILGICSQLGNTTVLAAKNEDVMDLLKELGEYTVVDTSEDKTYTTDRNTSNGVTNIGEYHRNDISYMEHWTVLRRDTQKAKMSSQPASYSKDGKTSYGLYTGKQYKTTLGLTNYKKMRDEFEIMLGMKNIYYYGPNVTLGTLKNNVKPYGGKTNPYLNTIYSKSGRAKLTKMAIDAKLIKTGSGNKVAHLIAPFTYFKVINDPDGLVKYNASSKAYVSREEAAVMMYRYGNIDEKADNILASKTYKSSHEYKVYKTSKYAPLVRATSHSFMISSGQYGFTRADQKANITKLEFIYMIMENYYGGYVDNGRNQFARVDRAFKDITVKNNSKTDYLKKYGKIKGITKQGIRNKARRDLIKTKKLSEYECQVINGAIKIGILKKDTKGNSNLFKPISYNDAIEILNLCGNTTLNRTTLTK